MVRKIVLVLAIVTEAIGFTQVLAAGWWICVTDRFAGLIWLRIFGLVGIAMGAVLIYAAVRNIVGLKQFVLILGAIVVGISLVAAANPSFLQDLLYALMLNRARFYQLTVARLAGIVRIAIGLALLYAVKIAPQPSSSSVSAGS